MIPLKQTEPYNFWFSQRGFDLAVVPLPSPLVTDAACTDTGGRFLTAKNYKELKIAAGAVAIANVIQFEFLNDRDFRVPEIIPLLRCGHISRLGVFSDIETNYFSRDHVVDLHASHGNSGSPVLTYTTDGKSVLLGLIKGFNEEQWSKHPTEATVTNKVVNVCLTDTRTSKTNQFVTVMIPEANPNLMWVTPVEELASLNQSASFTTNCVTMLIGYNSSLYSTVELLVRPWPLNQNPPPPPADQHSPNQLPSPSFFPPGTKIDSSGLKLPPLDR